MISSRFVRFAAVGGFAAAVNLAARYGLNFFMPFGYAVVLAYGCGMVVAYSLNRLFVFEKSGRRVADEFWRFALVNLVAAVQVWAISVGLGEYLFPHFHFTFYPLLIAHIVGVLSPIVTSYLGHRHFSFSSASSKSN